MAGELQLSLLGKLQVNRDGQPITGFVSTKAQALLCYLAVTGRPHNRQMLATLLWGEMAETEAKANLRTTLFNLRKLVGDHLEISREAIGFNLNSSYWLDVELFQKTLIEAGILTPEKVLQTSDVFKISEVLLPPLRQAVELYQGDFLEGFTVRESPEFEEWLFSWRERLRQLAVQALHTLVTQHTIRGEYAAGIDYTSRLLALEPWREEAHRQMMILLARSGQRSAALAQYETCCRLLAEELGVEPMVETTALYERLKAAGAVCPHNLPPQTTAFVGREEELARIDSYLDNPDCRLLTLVGSGGIGKTRLALEAGARCLQLATFQDGIFVVSLVAINSPDLIVAAIIEALNVAPANLGDLKTHLLNTLRSKELLLILDNFEHLLAGVDLVIELLNCAPHLKIVTTSRERLNLREEWVMEVTGLAYPLPNPKSAPGSGTISLAEEGQGQELVRYSAVNFFLQQVQRVQANFSLTLANQQHVLRLCQLVTGIPLGLELAATWLPLLTCADIVAEIERDLSFLTTSLRNVPDRHRSMRVVFESSWALLSETEREVFEKLSVFRGSFEARAAVEVTGASLPLLFSLLSKSLLRRDALGRYDMHELIRQYAASKLAERVGENGHSPAHDTAARHCHYYATFLQERETRLMGAQQEEALEEINLALENIRLAWQWAIQHRQIDELERGLEGLRLFYEWRSWFQEGEEAFKQAIEHLSEGYAETPSEPKKALILGRLLTCQGRLLYYQGLYEKAKVVLKRGLSIFRGLDQPIHLAFALHSLGLVAAMQGDYDRARTLSQESLQTYQSVGDEAGMARPLYTLARVAYNVGDYDTAKYFCEESLSLYHKIGNRRGIADCLSTLGLIVCGLYLGQLSEHPEAAQLFQENLAICRTIGDRHGEAKALHNLGYIHCELERYQQAQEHFQTSLGISTAISDLYLMAATMMWLGVTAMEQLNYQEARRYFGDSLKIAHETGGLVRATDVLYRFSDLLQREGRRAKAVEYLAFVHQHPATDDRVRGLSQSLLDKLASVLPAQTLATVRARGAHRTLNSIVVEVLGD